MSGDVLGEVILGPLAMDSGEQHRGDGNDEEGAEDLEDEWVMSPEWAEHFRNSPSVQRYRECDSSLGRLTRFLLAFKRVTMWYIAFDSRYYLAPTR